MKSANQKHEADNNWDTIISLYKYEPKYIAGEKGRARVNYKSWKYMWFSLILCLMIN